MCDESATYTNTEPFCGTVQTEAPANGVISYATFANPNTNPASLFDYIANGVLIIKVIHTIS